MDNLNLNKHISGHIHVQRPVWQQNVQFIGHQSLPTWITRP